MNTSNENGAYTILFLSEDETPASKWGAIYHLNSGWETSGIFQARGLYVDADDTNGTWIGSRNAAGGFHVFTGGSAAANERMTVLSGGYVGIGTTNPGAPLDVQGSNATTFVAANLKNTNAGDHQSVRLVFSPRANFAVADNGGYIEAIRPTNDIVSLAFGGYAGTVAEWMRITNGKVGIGTIAPGRKLHIEDASEPNVRLHYSGTAAAGNKGLLEFTHKRNSDSAVDQLGYIQGVAENNESAGGIRFVARNNTDVEVIRITSKGSLNLSGFNIKYIPIGTNTVSDAVTAMSDGDCLVLGAGTYTQTVAVAIPTSVTRFAIIGQGSAVSIINYTANVGGIFNSTALDSYRIRRAVLAAFSMTYSSGTTNTTSGIKLWGSNYETYYKPGILLHDLALHYVDGSNNDCWVNPIHLIDCRPVTIDKVYIRRQANSRNGTGITLESCLNTRISNSFIMCVGTGITLLKASDSLIDGSTKHGCEDITLMTSTIYKSTRAVNLGYKCLSAKINTTEFAGVTANAIYEDVSSGYTDGGYHKIDNVYVDLDSENWSSGATLMYIARPGTVIRGCHFHLPTDKTLNGIVFDGGQDGKLGTASDNVFTGGTGYGGASGIYMASNYCKATGNVFTLSYTGAGTGADISIASGVSGNLADNNMIDNRLLDSGTGSILGNNPVH